MRGKPQVRRRMWSAIAVVALLVPLASMASVAQPDTFEARGYRFTEIAHSRRGFDSFDCPAINDLGHVAFRAVTDEGVQGIFRVMRRTLTTIVVDTGEFSFLGRNPSINDQGQVSFAATLSDFSEAIFVGDGGPLTTIARTDPGDFNFFGFDTSLNRTGHVAFKAELDPEFGFDEGLFVGDGGPVTTIYLASTSQFTGTDTRPSINDAGQIAFEETLDDFTNGIFLFTEGQFVTIADESGPLDFAFDPQLSEDGVVVLTAFLDSGEMGIFTGTGGPLTTVVDTSGPFNSFAFFGGPSINEGGTVAFVASLDTGEQGLFVGPDPVDNRVILTGDRLFGSTVTSLSVCSEGLNNEGEIAFVPQFANGESGIFVAIPL